MSNTSNTLPKPSADGSLYFPMDGPWGSEEDKEAYKKADDAFNQYKEIYPYVALIRSHHWASHGYWVEIKEKKVEYPDIIEKYHRL